MVASASNDVSGPPRRNRVLLALAAFVLAFGGVSWVATGGFNTLSSSAGGASVVPKPPHCGHDLEVVGVFSECAVAMPDQTTSCGLNGNNFEDARLRFVGAQVIGFDIEMDGAYNGTGPYQLMPWPSGGLNGPGTTPKVGVEEYSSDTLWQSVAGVLTITRSDGEAGTINAVLRPSTATVAVPPTISVIGPWSCP